MPKQTFFNLAEEKHQRILDAAVEEFAQRGYKDATISGIVERAKIPKGSFYQYFEDKDDLYCYIVTSMIAERKLKSFAEEEGRLEELNLTEFLRAVFRRQMAEFTAKPLMMKIGIDMLQMVNEPVFKRVIEPYRALYDTYFIPYIQHEVEQGELDPKVNQRLLNFMLISLGQYVIAAINAGQEITTALIDSMVDDLDYILKNGIYRKGRE